MFWCPGLTEAAGAGGLSPKYSWEALCNGRQLQPFTKYTVLKGQAGEMHITSPKDRWVTCLPRERQELTQEASEVLQRLLFLQLRHSPPCSPVAQRKGGSPKLSWQRDLARTKPTSSHSKWGMIHRSIGNRRNSDTEHQEKRAPAGITRTYCTPYLCFSQQKKPLGPAFLL